RIPEFTEFGLFVNPFGGDDATRQNRAVMRGAFDWLRDGHVLGIFPAGEVASYSWKQRCVTDPAWSTTVARFAARANAPVVPVFFDGTNRLRFHLVGMVHPRLRTALLPREMVARSGRPLRAVVGNPISQKRLAQFGQAATSRDTAERDITEYLRLRTYVLRGRLHEKKTQDSTDTSLAPHVGAKVAHEIVAPISPAVLATELGALPLDALLVSHNELRVYCARAAEIPQSLREIGRLREVTFRAVGEGTGNAIDLDRFDSHYHHLLVWDATQQRILGSYRMGCTDEIVSRFGISGLYTSTLFRFRQKLIRQINPAIELGRSFVVRDAQKSYAALMLLWKGIGAFVAKHPRYRNLYGVVSISDGFTSMTKELLVQFLQANRFDRDRAKLVHAKNPPKLAPFRDLEMRALSTIVDDVKDVDELVREIEADRAAVPVLVRQYLKLNARFLGFNVDPDFGDVLDGLVFVDLKNVDRDVLDRFIGKDETAEFLAMHSEGATDMSRDLKNPRRPAL
ncbi:MAG: lysophospholipid acyltransferase family protein, partial [Phycisphaerae bacterium]